MKRGTVYLVGAGPGDPKLLTLRGRELLQQADVVVYDHLVSPRLLRHCGPDAQLLYAGKESNRHTLSQSAINTLLIRHARAGKTVVRLKGGDPFLFGRGGEEALQLARARVPFEIVPGVTSALAVPAYAGVPLTQRQLSSSVAILTGHEDSTKAAPVIRWDRLATACDTLVVLMGVEALPNITKRLLEHGRQRTTPAAAIEWGTLSRQRVVTGTLATIARLAKRADLHPPAILVVGDVVSLRRQLNWFERKPLFGRRILVTRASDKAEPLSDRLEALGADIEELPAIELMPVQSNGRLRRALDDASKPDWVFFTSPEGIGWFSRLLTPHRKDVRWLAGCHIGAIGPKTAAALQARGLHVDFVPARYSQEGMLDELPRRALSGRRALILSAAGSRDALETGLRRRGMRVIKIPIYRTAMPDRLARDVAALFGRPFDLITVTSASCVEHFAAALRNAKASPNVSQLKFASIGPVTSAAVRAAGGHVVVEAKVSTIEGLAEAMCRWGMR